MSRIQQYQNPKFGLTNNYGILMNNSELEKIVLDSLDDMQAKDVINLDVRPLTSITDTMIICNGTSKRHVRSIADHIIEAVKQENLRPLNVEGHDYGEWILIDIGNLVVHIMLPQIREFYSLEKLWATTESARASSR